MNLHPHQFFMGWLPRQILENTNTFMALGGVLSVNVRDEGSWTVRFGDAENPICEGADEAADLTLDFSPEAFAGFLDGTLAVQEAAANRDLVVHGQPRLLRSLMTLIQPPQSPLAARFAR